MATVGLRDLFYAPITEENGMDVYGTPKRMAKAISAELSVEKAEGTLYADDAIDVVETEFVSGEITLGANDLEPGIEVELLGQTKDENGVVYAGEGDSAPYVALGFRAKKPGGKFKYIWIYKTKFSIPDEKYETKKDGIEFSTPELTGTFIKRHDGLWKANTVAEETEPVAKNWFSKVVEPATVE